MAKILLIEDQTLVLETIELLLIKAGHSVITSANGVEGLAAYAAARPDLVVTDIMMPEKEGFQTIRELRAQAPSLPILAISGGIVSGGAKRDFHFLDIARKLGANDVLAKPFATADLLGRVAALTENRCAA